MPLPLIEATAYVNSRWQWIATPARDGGVGPMHITPAQMQSASALSGHAQAQIANDLGANVDAGAALFAHAHSGANDLASWQPAVVAVQGPQVATQIYDTLRAGVTATASTGEQITLVPQPVSNPPASAPPRSATTGGATAPTGTPDYPGATWVPASNANYSYANRPHDYPVQMIIIHDIEGTYGSAIQLFQDPNAQASAHYVVSDNGQITQMVAEKYIAWHAGNWDYNTRAIGIEHEGYAYAQPTWYTTTMYQASAHLIASICSRWGVPMDHAGGRVIGHSQVPDPNNPSLFGGSDHHTDPGPYWDWNYYMGLAQQYANALPSPPHMMPDPVAVLTGSSSATVTWKPAQSCHSPITGYTVTAQPGNLVMNLPATATSATINNLQPGVTYTFTVTATDADGQDTLTAHWQCSAVGETATPGSPQFAGTGITFSATASGCPNPQYQFWVRPPNGSWQVLQPYSTASTYRWDTNGLAAGNYLYTVWAQDSTSQGAQCSSLGCNDAFLAAPTYTLTTKACTSVTDTPSPGSPQSLGTNITFTASAAGCPSPQYQFWILPPGGSWQIAKPYSSASTFTWNTGGLSVGSYMYTVWARDASSGGTKCSSLGCNDAYYPGTNFNLVPQACASVTESPAPAQPQLSGTTVAFTASASGCSHPLYQFWVRAPGGTWTIAQKYSSSATFTWDTSGLAPGSYLYTVWARDTSSSGTQCSSLGCNDAFMAAASYGLTRQPCASVTESAAPASPQDSATAITFTASSSGCPHPLYQFWILRPGSSWQVAQAYSSSKTFTWDTTGLPPGNYLYTVWARDASSSGTQCSSLGCNDAYFAAQPFTLTTHPCTSVTESAAPGSPSASGTPITFTASANGCPHPLYQFWILRAGSSTWQVVQPWSTSNTYPWSTGGLPAGQYMYTVWARDASSAGTACSSLGCNDAYYPGTWYTLS